MSESLVFGQQSAPAGDRAELERLRKLKRLRELEAKQAGAQQQAAPVAPQNEDWIWRSTYKEGDPIVGLEDRHPYDLDGNPIIYDEQTGYPIEFQYPEDKARVAENIQRFRPRPEGGFYKGFNYLNATTPDGMPAAPEEGEVRGADFARSQLEDGVAFRTTGYYPPVDDRSYLEKGADLTYEGVNMALLGAPEHAAAGIRGALDPDASYADYMRWQGAGRAEGEAKAPIATTLARYGGFMAGPGRVIWNRGAKYTTPTVATSGSARAQTGAYSSRVVGLTGVGFVDALAAGATVEGSAKEAREGRPITLQERVNEGVKLATNPVVAAAPAAASLIFRGGKWVKDGQFTPNKVVAQRTQQQLGPILNATQQAPIREQAFAAIDRVLRGGGLTAREVSALNAEVRKRMEAFKPGTAEARQDITQVSAKVLDDMNKPAARDAILMQAQERAGSNIADDASSTIVADRVKEGRTTQTEFIEGQADKAFGSVSRKDLKQAAKDTKREIGDKYDEVLKLGAATPEQAGRLSAIVTDPRLRNLINNLKIDAAAAGKPIDELIESNPLAAAHWMQSAALKRSQNGTDPLATAYGNLRTRLLKEIEASRPEYAQIRRDFGEAHQVDDAVKFGDRLFGGSQSNLLNNPGMRDELVESYKALSADARRVADQSIRDALKGRIQGGPEGAPARLTTVTSTAALDFLEQIGRKDIADDLRAIRDENAYFRQIDTKNPAGNSATFSNFEAKANAPAARNSRIANAVDDANPGTMAGEGALMIFAPHYQGAYAGYRLSRMLAKAGFGTRKSTLEDMTRFLMSRRQFANPDAPVAQPMTKSVGGSIDAATAIGAGLGALGAGDSDGERITGAVVGGALGRIVGRGRVGGSSSGNIQANGAPSLGGQRRLSLQEQRVYNMAKEGRTRDQMMDDQQINGNQLRQVLDRIKRKGWEINVPPRPGRRDQRYEDKVKALNDGVTTQGMVQRFGMTPSQVKSLRHTARKRGDLPKAQGLGSDFSDLAAFAGGAAFGHLGTPEEAGPYAAQLNAGVSGIAGLLAKRGAGAGLRAGANAIRNTPNPFIRVNRLPGNLDDVTVPGRGASPVDDMLRVSPDGPLAQWPNRLSERLREAASSRGSVAAPKGEDFGLPNLPGAPYQAQGAAEFSAIANAYERAAMAAAKGDIAAVKQELADLMRGAPAAQIDEVAQAVISQGKSGQASAGATGGTGYFDVGGWRQNPDVMKAYERAGSQSGGFSVPPPEAFNLPKIPFVRPRAMSPNEFEQIANTYERIQKAAISGNRQQVEQLLREASIYPDIPPQVMDDTLNAIMKRFGHGGPQPIVANGLGSLGSRKPTRKNTYDDWSIKMKEESIAKIPSMTTYQLKFRRDQLRRGRYAAKKAGYPYEKSNPYWEVEKAIHHELKRREKNPPHGGDGFP